MQKEHRMKTNQLQKNIPKDWKTVALREVCDYKNGGSFESFISKTGKYFLITLNSIDINGKLKEEHKRVDEAEWFLEQGDLIMVLSDIAHGYFLGSVAKIAKDNLYVLNQRMGLLRNKKMEILDTNYLQSSIQVNRKYFKKHGQGSSQQNLSKDDILNFRFPLPPLHEQNRIVSVLETWDEAIEKLKQKIAIKKEIKKGLMQELLTGKKRLSGFSGEWRNSTLEDVMTKFSTGLNPRQNFELGNGDNYYVTIKNIFNGELDFSKAEFVDDKALGLINKRSGLCRGDIIMSSIGNVGEAYLLENDPNKWDINESVFCLKPNTERVLSKFIYYFITSANSKKYFENHITGSSFKSIKMKELKSMPFLLPSLEEQEVIVSILTTTDDEITTLVKKLTLWQEQKKYLLNNLVTGQIRTPENLLETINHK